MGLRKLTRLCYCIALKIWVCTWAFVRVWAFDVCGFGRWQVGEMGNQEGKWADDRLVLRRIIQSGRCVFCPGSVSGSLYIVWRTFLLHSCLHVLFLCSC